MKFRRGMILVTVLMAVIVCAWAIENQGNEQNLQPNDFRYQDPNDYPDLTNIILDIKGFAEYGKIYMLEGLENTTSLEYSSSQGFTPGTTSYPHLVMYGVFNRYMRDWRDQIIAGQTIKHDMELKIQNKSGQQILRIMIYGTFPIKFSIPPFSIENNTRYMERIEFAYTNFTIID